MRAKGIALFFWEIRQFEAEPELEALLAGADYAERELPNARISVRHLPGPGNRLSVQIWGHHLIVRPDRFPISQPTEQDLAWPGLAEPVSKDNYRSFGVLDYVYVDDRVLGAYERKPEYEITPESGSVNYRSQWTIGFCRRIDRSVIQLEVKKLYEGCPPHVIRHWHNHAVAPPVGSIDHLRNTPNVGSRSRRLVYALIQLGEVLASIQLQRGYTAAAESAVRVSRREADYSGWWTLSAVGDIADHIPLDCDEARFVGRCAELAKLCIEGLNEAFLRTILVDLGINGDLLANVRSLKLLGVLVEISHRATATGERPAALGARADESLIADSRSRCGRLTALNALRQLSAHRTGTDHDNKLRRALHQFDLDPKQTASGFGLAADAIYDGVADEIEAAAKLMAGVNWQQ